MSVARHYAAQIADHSGVYIAACFDRNDAGFGRPAFADIIEIAIDAFIAAFLSAHPRIAAEFQRDPMLELVRVFGGKALYGVDKILVAKISMIANISIAGSASLSTLELWLHPASNLKFHLTILPSGIVRVQSRQFFRLVKT